MDRIKKTMAQQVAQAVREFQQVRTGHSPRSVTVVMGEGTLVVTLHGALSAVERTVAQTPAGAAQVQEFHRQLFNSSAGTLRGKIKEITGVEVRESAAEVEPSSGTVVHAFASGTMVQVFLMATDIPAEVWNGSGNDGNDVGPAAGPTRARREPDASPTRARRRQVRPKPQQ